MNVFKILFTLHSEQFKIPVSTKIKFKKFSSLSYLRCVHEKKNLQ